MTDPLHGVTLEAIVTRLHAHYGWEQLAQTVTGMSAALQPGKYLLRGRFWYTAHGTTASISSRNCSRRVFFEYRWNSA